MDLQARYGAKSECFERICQRATGVKEEGLVDLVRDELAQLPPQSKDRLDWEYVVRAKIWDHVAKEGELTSNPETRDEYFKELFLRLDLALVYTELETCNWQYVLEVLEEVLDGHTVDSCVTIFDWVETRSARLLKGMIPSKGKALVVLRTLNALKARAARTGFAGRILAFQSGIFDITERSGVNLQGELGSTWNGVALPPKEEKPQAEGVETVKTEGGDAMEGVESTDAKPDTGDKKSTSETKPSSDTKPPLRTLDPAEQRRNLYNTFWQLQMYFANPLVFAEGVSAQVAAANGLPSVDMKPVDVFAAFKKAVDTIVPVLGERTRKDNALMGRESKGSAAPVVGVKRKRTVSAGVRRIRDQIDDENAREVELEQAAVEEKDLDKYFFAKFLTSPDLLELELADTNFRRQILFQLMILLKHLLLTIHYSKPPAPPAPAQPPAQTTPMLIPNAKSLAAKQPPPAPQPAPTPAPAPAPAPPTTAQLRRKRLMGDIVLPAEDEQWIRRMMTNCLDEWRATGAGSVRELFTREEHWVDWKNNMCSPFEKRDFSEVTFTEQAKKSREDMIFRPLNVWRNPLGSASLTAVWDNKYGGVEDLEDVHRPPSMQKFENMNKAINIQIQRAEAAIAAEIAARNPPPVAQPTPEASANLTVEGDTGTPAPGTPKPVAKPLSTLGVPPKPNIPSRPGTPAPPAQPQATTIFARPQDEELPRAPKVAPRLTPKQRMLEDHQLTKTKICWQALRAASLLGHGRVFTQLGVGSVDMLIQEIEKDKKKYDDDRAKRLSAKAEEANKVSQTGGVETVEGEGDKTEEEKAEGGKLEAEKAETMEVDA